MQAHHKISVYAGALSTLTLVIMVWGRDFCFSTDDFIYLSKVYNPNDEFLLGSFHTYLSRIPVSAFLMWVMFKFQFISDHNWYAIYIMFAVHTMVLVQFADYLNQQLGNKPLNPMYLLIVATIIAFFPNTYEIIYWPTTLNYIIGAAFMVAGLRVKQPWLRIVLLIVSYMNSEMFLLPALASLLVPQIKQINIKQGINQGVFWLVSIVIFLSIRYGLGHIFGFSPDRIQLDAGLFFENFIYLLERTFLLHFHKLYYPISAFFLLLLGISFTQAIRKRWIGKKELFLTLLLVTASGTIVLPLNYSAVRALYGAQLFTMALAIVGLAHLFAINKRWGISILASLSLLFAVHHQLIFQIKDFNHNLLQEKAEKLSQEMAKCEDSCEIQLESIDAGLKRDWVMHPDYWQYFARYIEYKNHPGRDISYLQER